MKRVPATLTGTCIWDFAHSLIFLNFLYSLTMWLILSHTWPNLMFLTRLSAFIWVESISGKSSTGSQIPNFPPMQDFYVLRGIHRLPSFNPRHSRLPFTSEILHYLFISWSQWPQEDRHDASMLWAVSCMRFFGFMRAGEFTCPSLRAYTPTMLCPADVSVDSHQVPSVVHVHLHQSKNDPFGAGVIAHLGRTGRSVCPLAAVLDYLVRRRMSPGPLFFVRDGSPLSRGSCLSSLNAVWSTPSLSTIFSISVTHSQQQFSLRGFWGAEPPQF